MHHPTCAPNTQKWKEKGKKCWIFSCSKQHLQAGLLLLFWRLLFSVSSPMGVFCQTRLPRSTEVIFCGLMGDLCVFVTALLLIVRVKWELEQFKGISKAFPSWFVERCLSNSPTPAQKPPPPGTHPLTHILHTIDRNQSKREKSIRFSPGDRTLA